MLTAHQAIASSISEYPLLYSSYSYDDSKFMVLNQIFNVLGSGINNLEDLKNNYPDNSAPNMPEEKYINGTVTFTGYMSVHEYDMGDVDALIMPDSESQRIKGVTEDSKEQHPEIIYWLAEGPNDRSPPYPNFDPKYSWAHTLTKEDWQTLDPSWLDAAVWFYEQCRAYFSDPTQSNTYDRAYPNADDFEHEDKLMDAVEKVMQLKKDRPKDQWLKDVSEQYGVAFTGDVDRLLTDRWEKERQRIMSFIDDTLKTLHNARPSSKNTLC